MNFLRKSKKQYFSNINVSDVTDSKSFWKSVKPYFSKKDQILIKSHYSRMMLSSQMTE